jgi:hypothetical protein
VQVHVKAWEFEVYMQKIIIAIVSVTSLFALCKPAMAEEPVANNFWSGFKLGGYSSAGVEIPRNDDTKASLNEISLLATWNGDSRWSFFGELELEHPLTWDDDRKFHTKESRLDLERLYLDYNFSETVNLRMGRFLTPNSRWNLLHAAPLVWTSTRPLSTYRLFPTATNGLMLHGSVNVNDYALDYMLFTELLEDQEDDGYELPFEHVRGARIALSKQWNVGLSLLSFVEKDIAALGDQNKTYRMLGMDFITHLGGAEISGEGFARFTSSGGDGGSGAYLQAAVPLNALGLQNWYWLTRLETLQRPNEGSAERWLTGATWRIKPTQLLKLEFTGGSGNQPEAPRGFIASYALFF